MKCTNTVNPIDDIKQIAKMYENMDSEQAAWYCPK